MALEKYKQKRNFNQTPEPSGDTAHRSPHGRTARFFCVQKHLASHLHYDFRLEHNGVLLSWAVPKGPALDPATKRLAMHVEDHPVDYGEFEGVIPSGYGAGIVMLWDKGTWTPEVDDVDAALEKGDLKFTLDGFKLKGSWVLVRTSGGRWGGGKPGDARSWLLIKHRDEWAGDVDIAEFAPLSVKSEGDFAEILSKGNPEIWHSHRPAAGGEAGAMFAKIIERALAMKTTGSPASAPAAKQPPAAAERGTKKSAKKRAKASPAGRAPRREPGAVKKAAAGRAPRSGPGAAASKTAPGKKKATAAKRPKAAATPRRPR